MNLLPNARKNNVHRLITDEEMMDIYHLELQVQSELKSYWKRSKSKPTRAFTSQLPVKVLRSVGTRLVKGLLGTDDEHESCNTDYDSDNTIIARNTKSDLSRFSYEESIANELLDDDSENANNDSSDRAARANDDEVRAEDWDIWIVENFKAPDNTDPKICTRKYMEKIHSPFFESLRK
jgi:hypothetical protein